MANTASSYLEYLDKEMTIMGILSTFCVAVVALVLDRVGSADLSKQTVFSLWTIPMHLDWVSVHSACGGVVLRPEVGPGVVLRTNHPEHRKSNTQQIQDSGLVQRRRFLSHVDSLSERFHSARRRFLLIRLCADRSRPGPFDFILGALGANWCRRFDPGGPIVDIPPLQILR